MSLLRAEGEGGGFVELVSAVYVQGVRKEILLEGWPAMPELRIIELRAI